jgi:hypothetical protein
MRCEMGSKSRQLVKATRRAGRASTRTDEERRMSGHRYIAIEPQHLGKQRAQEHVDGLLRRIFPGEDVARLRNKTFEIGNGERRTSVTYNDAVQMAMARGSAESLYTLANAGDEYYVFGTSVSYSGEGPRLGLGQAGHTLELGAPMRMGMVEEELTDDILEHRLRASEHSLKDNNDYRMVSCHYNASCAIVEAFINRCVQLDLFRKRSSDALSELQEPRPVVRKFELWLEHFCGEPLSALNGGAEWNDYQMLRKRRNDLMHPPHLMLGIELKAVADHLNLVRRGVGGHSC